MIEKYPSVCYVSPTADQRIHDMTLVALSKHYQMANPIFDAEEAKRLKSQYDSIYDLIAETFPSVD